VALRRLILWSVECTLNLLNFCWVDEFNVPFMTLQTQCTCLGLEAMFDVRLLEYFIHVSRTFEELVASVHLGVFIGSVSRTKTMHQVLGFKCKFPNYFVFTLGS
jgi:hypothetical protein